MNRWIAILSRVIYNGNAKKYRFIGFLVLLSVIVDELHVENEDDDAEHHPHKSPATLEWVLRGL
jgi:hypothetical protein